MAAPGTALTVINGGMNRLRIKGAARSDTLYLLQDGYVTAANTVKKRPGTIRNANLATLGGAGNSKGLVAFQNALHVFSAQKIAVPAGYVDHVLTHPAANATYTPPFPGLGFNPVVESLLQFEDGNGSVAFTDTGGAGAAWTGAGGAQESSAQAMFGTGSLLCNSLGNYIQTTVTSGSAMDLATGNPDWTIEFWFWPTTVTAGTTYMLFDFSNNNATFGRMYFSGPNGLVFQVFGGGSWGGAGGISATASATLVAGQWNHIALCRDNNILRAFVNGAYAGISGSFTGMPAPPSTQPWYVGGSPHSIFGGAQTMYIDGFRITKGACVYGGTFNVPTTAPTTAPSIPFTIASLQHFDDGAGSTTFTDAVGGVAWTAHGAAAEVAAPLKFGTSAGAFLNNADYIQHSLTANSNDDLTYDNCDYTYEAFIYPVDVTGGTNHTWAQFSHRVSTGLDDTLFYLQSNSHDLTLYDRSSSFTIITGVGALPTAAQWYHVAVTRYGDTLLLFVNGVQVGSGATAGAYSLIATADKWYSGSFGSSGTLSADGYIDEQRITRGVALYRANFTPPVAPYTAPGVTPIALKDIHFAAPFMGFLYVVAEFTTDGGTGLGTVFHYWLQTSGTWAPKTIYQAGQIVSPVTANGLTYKAVRLNTPNPSWAPSTLEALNNIVEPTVANGYKFTATKIDGLNPLTGSTEPTWPTTDGATVVEETERTNTGIVTTAAPQPTATTPSPGIGFGPGGKYGNLYSGAIIK